MDWETLDGFFGGVGRACALIALLEMTCGVAWADAGLAILGGALGCVTCLMETLWFRAG